MSSLPILDQPTHRPGPIETALEALWRLKSSQFYSFKNVTTVLRLRRRFSLNLLTLDKLKVAIPRGQVPDCDNCVDLCCTGPDALVSLRLRDIAVLMDLGKTAHIAWDRPPALASKTTRTAKVKPSPAAWARREADGSIFHQAFPILLRDATGTCTLLTQDRLCGVFPSWPLSCARYPYALDLRSGVIFYARGCGSTRIADLGEAPWQVRRLARAVVDAYNARVRDVVLLAMAKEELGALGLLAHVKLDELGL